MPPQPHGCSKGAHTRPHHLGYRQGAPGNTSKALEVPGSISGPGLRTEGQKQEAERSGRPRCAVTSCFPFLCRPPALGLDPASLAF